MAGEIGPDESFPRVEHWVNRAALIRFSPIAVAVDPVALVVTECITVTSAMRKDPRWRHSSVSAILGGGGVKAPPSQRRDRGRALVGNAMMLDDEETVTNRWGLRGKKGKSMQDHPLMAAFSRLRADLRGCKDIRTYDTTQLLHPFLQVIRASSTSAPITSLAIIAITKFLSYGIISRDSPRLAEAMQLLALAITNCRFEASDSSADEVVLLRILKLMEGMVSGPGGDILADESICALLETGISICCQGRLSEVLRRSAEISMVAMCQVIFERLKSLEIEVGGEPAVLDETTKKDMDTVKMDPTVKGNTLTVPQPAEEASKPSSNQEKLPDSGEAATNGNVNDSQADLHETAEKEDEEELQIKPYSLPSIRELFRVLVNLLDPHDKDHTDTMRIMALRIVDVALEVAGPSIATHPSLASLAQDTLCRHLFQLVRSENLAILNESLRVAYTLLATCRSVLKLQQELFLSYVVACLYPRVEIPREEGIEPFLYEGVPQAPSLVKPPPSQSSSGRSTPVPVKDRQKLGLEGGSRKPDSREAMVESVGALVRIPSFMVELFVNYDCEIDRSNLCLDMVGLLSRNAFPDSATWSTTNVPPLCLDALLGYVQFIADRLDDKPIHEGYPDVDELRQQRQRKKIIVHGASKFNDNPKGGIAFLASQGVIENPDDPHCIAKFIKGTTRLDKKVLGEFLSKKANEAILSAYLDLFDFTGLRVDEALRKLLNTFRLPGESALIERIVDHFSEQYFEKSKPEGIADKTAVFVLTYAIIMLNTDQHNPNLKSQNRMALEDFAKNLRGVNGNENFAPEYLEEIYNSIKTREIILPEEHDNKLAYDHAWQELLIKIESTPDLAICNTNIFDADMFAATWKPIVATLSYVFMSATDDAVFSRVITGFDQCAQIAAKYGINECLDRIILCLSYISTLAPDTAPNTALNTEVQVDKKTVMVSETAVRFGRDERAQLATVVLFRLLNGNESTVQDGWDQILRILLNLFVNSLVPTSFSDARKQIDLPPIPLQNPVQVVDKDNRSSDAGLFSAFTSYVSSFANDEPPEPSDQEIEYTLCTVDTINACSLDQITSNISKLPANALRPFVDSLLVCIPEESSPRVIVVKSDLPPQSPRTNGSKPSQSKLPTYDPALVYVLELATILVIRNEATVKEFGKELADALQTVIRDASNVHPVIVARAVYYLLMLLRASSFYDFIRAPVVLHAFSSFDAELLKQCAAPLLMGIISCITGALALRNEMASSPDFWSILSQLYSIPEAAPKVFQVIEKLTDAAQSGITADNYEAAVALLNEFATAGSVGARDEQIRDQPAKKRGHGVPMMKTQTTMSDAVVRGKKAMGIIYQLTNRIPYLIEQSHLESNEAWSAYWSPIFRALATQGLNPCRDIRQQAFSILQRTLLSKDLASTEHKQWTAIFSEVLFPLIKQLLKPEVYQTDPIGMSETRVRAATLLCKIYLHYLVDLSEWEGLLGLWTGILEVCDRMMGSGQGDNLEEAVSENLKNILLVMANGGYLTPPNENSTQQQEEVWIETWKRLDRFLPRLYGELFPEEAKKGPPATFTREKKDGAAGEAAEKVQEPQKGNEKSES